MIRLPLSNYSSPPLEVHVEQTDDGDVFVGFDLHPDELVGRLPDRPVSGFIRSGPYAEGDEITPLRERIAELLEERDDLVEWNGKLRDLLDRVKDRASLSWDLRPEEARALASMLWHYADRADAPR